MSLQTSKAYLDQGAGSDKGKGKMLEYEVNHPNESNSDVSTPSLDSEFGVPVMRIPDVKKVLTSTNEKLRRLSRENGVMKKTVP